MSNPNVNCLKGKRCPTCGSYDEFNITCETQFTFNDDGEVDHNDLEFDEDSYAECCQCHHHGKWQDFNDPPENPKHAT